VRCAADHRLHPVAIVFVSSISPVDMRRLAISYHDDESSAKSRNFTNPMPGVEAAGGPGIAMAAPESP